jgi:hypothetical protein
MDDSYREHKNVSGISTYLYKRVNILPAARHMTEHVFIHTLSYRFILAELTVEESIRAFSFAGRRKRAPGSTQSAEPSDD